MEDADAGPLRQFIRFARFAGLNLDVILDEELRSIAERAAQSHRVPAHALVDMLQICSVITRRPDLGVSFAEWGNMRGLGPLSLLWDHCPTLADAIRVNMRYVRLDSGAIAHSLEENAEETAVRYMLLSPARYGSTQFIEGTLLLSTRIGRLILGDEWAPIRIELQHSSPEDDRVHRRLFRCPIEFGAERSAMVVLRDDFRRSTPNGNAHLLAFLEHHLETTQHSIPLDTAGRVDQLIAANLTMGNATIDHVAKLLCVSRRTLQRHLDCENTSFRERLDAVRQRVVNDYFRTEAHPNLALLAHRLGYGDASAASRYLRTRLQVNARTLSKRGSAE